VLFTNVAGADTGISTW